MKQDHNIWDDQLRKAMEGLEGEVRMGSWDAIEQSLDKSDRRKRFFLYFSIAAVLVILGSGLFFGWQNQQSESDQVVTTKKTSETTTNKTADITDQDKPVDSSEEVENIDQSKDWNTGSEEDQSAGTADQGKSVKSGTTQQKEDSPENKDSKTSDPELKETKDIAGDADKNTQKDADPELEDKESKDIAKDDINKTSPEHKPALEDTTKEGDIAKDDTPETEDGRVDDPDAVDKNTIKKPSINPGSGQAKRLELGLTFNTGLARQLISANPVESWRLNDRFMNLQQSSLLPSAGYTLRLNALYYLNPRTYLASGLSLTQKDENVNYNFVITEGLDINYVLKTVSPLPLNQEDYDTIKFNNTNTYQFVEIPLRIGKIVTLGNKWEFRAEGGLNYMLLLQAKGKSIDETFLTLNELSAYKHLKKHVLGAGVKAGFYYTGYPSWRLGIEPGYETSIGSLYDKKSAIKVNPYNYGLHFTANYLIRR